MLGYRNYIKGTGNETSNHSACQKKSWNPWEIETETLIQFCFARSVPVDQQPYALGLQSDIIKLLGTISGPIVLGALIDNTCILWDKG